MSQFKPVLALVFAAIATSFCVAQANVPKHPMTFEDMMRVKRLGDTTVSPDGKWLVYSAATVNLAENRKWSELWIQPVAGGEAKAVTMAKPNDGGFQFAADGKKVLFLSDREHGQQVWIAGFNPETGATDNARRITDLATEADNARWTPDGKAIVFTSTVYPDCPAINMARIGDSEGNKCNATRDKALVDSKVKAQVFTHLLYRHWNHYTGDKRSHLFLLTLATGALRDLTPNDPHDVPPFSLGGDGGFAFSPDSKELAFTENLDLEPAISTNADIFTLDLTNPKAKQVQISTSKGGDFTPAYSPDGKYLAWRSEERPGYEADQFRLMVYNRATKQIKNLMPGLETWVEEFAWTPDSKKIFFTSGKAGEAPIYVTDLDGRYMEFSNRGEFSGLHPLADGKTMIASWMTVKNPTEVVKISYEAHLDSCSGVCDASGAGVEAITHLNDTLLAKLELKDLESFWFNAADGTKLQGFVIRPPAFDAAKKYPVKFLIHGGPQGAWGDSWSYRWNPELFAANGYVVVMINPRGSTGYGQKVVDGVNGDWGGKPYSDLMLGLDYAEQNYSFIDKNRECALGASYGGFMANWILGHSDRFKCIVSHDGMFNPESAYGETEELWFNEWEFKGKPWDYYGKPDEENPFRKWAPSMSAKNFKTPTLVVHGQLDYRLDVAEGFQLFTTLQRMNVPSKMLYFPDEGHWVLKPQNSQLWYKTVNEWVDQWAKK